MFTPMLIRVWMPIHSATPCATRAAKVRSSASACRPISNARRVSQKNIRMITVTPTKPSSSATTAIRKSVCASGR